jgi:hypothetical protein
MMSLELKKNRTVTTAVLKKITPAKFAESSKSTKFMSAEVEVAQLNEGNAPLIAAVADVKSRKPFQELSERGKMERLKTLFTREPEVQELEYYMEKCIRRRQ